MVRSPTQRRLTRAIVDRYAERAFGIGVADCVELSGGGFAAVWRVQLADGRHVVLKVGPPPHVPLLRYEAGLIAAEARYFRLVSTHAADVPVPPVLYEDDDWLFTGHLPGVALAAGEAAENGSSVRRQLGAAIAAVHAVTGTRFGYCGPRAHAGTWPDAFLAIIDDLLADAADWHVPLPVPPQALRAAVSDHAGLLGSIVRPALVHFDLWDGNVLATVDAAGVQRLSGLVDGERHLFGDPLIDFVSPALFRRIEEEPDHPFLVGYADATGGPVLFDGSACRRLTLYRIHLYLLMLVEMPSRDMNAADDRVRGARLADLLRQELRRL